MSRTSELTDLRPRSLAVSSPKERGFFMPFLLLFLATSFNFLLCFINTNVTEVAAAHVILFELVIVVLGLAVSMRVLDVHSMGLIGVFFLYLSVLVLVRAYLSPTSSIDVKIIRDFLIPLVFFCWVFAFPI